MWVVVVDIYVAYLDVDGPLRESVIGGVSGPEIAEIMREEHWRR